MCCSTGDYTGREWGDRRELVRTIRFGSYNIHNSRNGGLESELRGMYQADIDLGVFQDTKATVWIYARESGGYWFMVNEALPYYTTRQST